MVGLRDRARVGVFDARMVRIYRAIGWRPRSSAADGTGREAISVGLWHFWSIARRVARSAQVSPALSRKGSRRPSVRRAASKRVPGGACPSAPGAGWPV
jgi:hypothetical protein